MTPLFPKVRMDCRVHHVPRRSTISEVILWYKVTCCKAIIIPAKKLRGFCCCCHLRSSIAVLLPESESRVLTSWLWCVLTTMLCQGWNKWLCCSNALGKAESCLPVLALWTDYLGAVLHMTFDKSHAVAFFHLKGLSALQSSCVWQETQHQRPVGLASEGQKEEDLLLGKGEWHLFASCFSTS